MDARKRAMTVELYRGKQHTVGEICDMVGITKPMLYSYVNAADADVSAHSRAQLLAMYSRGARA